MALISSGIKSSAAQNFQTGYAPINGLQVYYEMHGSSKKGKIVPLVLIHGGGSTIETSFGKILPYFSRDRKIIAVELQAHGHTADIDRPLTFEQDADDIASLMMYLKIDKADFFGFSNGGNTALQAGIRHPEIINKLIIASSFFKRDGLYPQLWEGIKNAALENMPAKLKEGYLKVSNNKSGLQKMFNRDRERMLGFKDWDPKDIKSIKAPSLIITGDADVVKPEHAVVMYRLLPGSQLIVLPGGHGEYMGEITTNAPRELIESTAFLIENFLSQNKIDERKK